MKISRKTIDTLKEYFTSWDFWKFVLIGYVLIHILVLHSGISKNLWIFFICIFGLIDYIYIFVICMALVELFNGYVKKVHVFFFWISQDGDGYQLTLKNPK